MPEDTSRHPYGSCADSRGPSQVQSEDRTAPSVIERPVPICRLPTCPSSPNERIRQALATLDFTTLHSEALSANHMTVQHPKLPSEAELTQGEMIFGSRYNYTRENSPSFCTYGKAPNTTGCDFDEAVDRPPFQSPAVGQTRHCNSSAQDDLPLSLGLMFDPLWSPVMTKKAAITAYAIDLHREILRNNGLL
ncbi:unnamed protein product [Penicillium egyptiacum]|uniref:Uncharacterized protein n=1 Tax=Penicillium egyptiacum TaxID=1303716 RepID=A0A9W4P968_9EURO|nr:unnamed protein product [Penicillium egyptiacum]